MTLKTKNIDIDISKRNWEAGILLWCNIGTDASYDFKHLLKRLKNITHIKRDWSAIGWNTGPPMEELEKVPKELKGSSTL